MNEIASTFQKLDSEIFCEYFVVLQRKSLWKWCYGIWLFAFWNFKFGRDFDNGKPISELEIQNTSYEVHNA